MVLATVIASVRASTRGAMARGCAKRRSRMRENARRAPTRRRPGRLHERYRYRSRRMAAVGDFHPQPAWACTQACRQPACRRRRHGDEKRARRLYAAQRRRVDLGGTLGGHPRIEARRSRGVFRAGQRQGLPASDVFSDARRGEAPMSAAGRPERECRNAQHEGDLIHAKGRPEREYRSAQHEGDLIRATLATPLHEYLLRLADSPLVLAQRLCEWVGKGPALEEDIALANVGLDLLGQARMWFAYAGEVEAGQGDAGHAGVTAHDGPARKAVTVRDEDALAFRRDAHEFRNLLLVEQPNGDYAATIVRQFLFDHAQRLLLSRLAQSADVRIGAIAAKALKEVTYHVERSDDWMLRLGDGTDESHARMQRALDALWMYAGEMFVVDDVDLALIDTGIAADPRTLEAPWLAAVDAVLAAATLARPPHAHVQRGGRA